MKLRDYQDYAVKSIFRYFEKGNQGNPLVAMPTGTGKSLVIGDFIRRACLDFPGTRILKLTHSQELIAQNVERLLALWPTCPLGVYCAGLKRRDTGQAVTFASIGSVYKRANELGRIDLILIDECHLVGTNQDTMYRQLLSDMTEINPALKVIGLTATHYRVGQGSLLDGEDALFTDIAVDMTTLEVFNWFIDQGYLAPLIPKATNLELDISRVGVSRGEYKQKELQEAIDKHETTYAAIQETIEVAGDRKKWLVFAAGIEHAEHVTAMLDSLDISAACVHSKMQNKKRDQIITDYREGKYQAIVNNGILTTGFDDPDIDLIAALRPTRSPGLWVQMLGRGTRPVYADGFDLSTAEGRLEAIAAGSKQNCLVLDFARNTPRLGPINDPVMPKKRNRKGQEPGIAPIRECEQCGTYCHASLRVCPTCGFEFPRNLEINFTAGTDQLIRREDQPIVEPFEVDKVTYQKRHKAGKPSHLRVSYFCGLRRFTEAICLEHEGFPSAKARRWWEKRSTVETLPPSSIDEALERVTELQSPRRIFVWLNRKFPEITDYQF